MYVGKGKWVVDDPSKYASRDGWFTGGWPGGEVGLKERFNKEAFVAPGDSGMVPAGDARRGAGIASGDGNASTAASASADPAPTPPTPSTPPPRRPNLARDPAPPSTRLSSPSSNPSPRLTVVSPPRTPTATRFAPSRRRSRRSPPPTPPRSPPSTTRARARARGRMASRLLQHVRRRTARVAGIHRCARRRRRPARRGVPAFRPREEDVRQRRVARSREVSALRRRVPRPLLRHHRSNRAHHLHGRHRRVYSVRSAGVHPPLAAGCVAEGGEGRGEKRRGRERRLRRHLRRRGRARQSRRPRRTSRVRAIE